MVEYSRSGSERTRKAFTRTFALFCRWAGKNPDELIGECETPGGVEAARRRLEEYLGYLLKCG